MNYNIKFVSYFGWDSRKFKERRKRKKKLITLKLCFIEKTNVSFLGKIRSLKLSRNRLICADSCYRNNSTTNNYIFIFEGIFTMHPLPTTISSFLFFFHKFPIIISINTLSVSLDCGFSCDLMFFRKYKQTNKIRVTS